MPWILLLRQCIIPGFLLLSTNTVKGFSLQMLDAGLGLEETNPTTADPHLHFTFNVSVMDMKFQFVIWGKHAYLLSCLFAQLTELAWLS